MVDVSEDCDDGLTEARVLVHGRTSRLGGFSFRRPKWCERRSNPSGPQGTRAQALWMHSPVHRNHGSCCTRCPSRSHPRIVPGGASRPLVGPMRVLATAMASLPVQAMATIGPLVMNRISPS